MLKGNDRAAHVVALLLAGLVAAAAWPASAMVRFGAGVSIGGHDVSNQTYDKNHRAIFHLYDRKPRHTGCVWHRDGRGRIKVCRWRRLLHP